MNVWVRQQPEVLMESVHDRKRGPLSPNQFFKASPIAHGRAVLTKQYKASLVLQIAAISHLRGNHGWWEKLLEDQHWWNCKVLHHSDCHLLPCFPFPKLSLLFLF